MKKLAVAVVAALSIASIAGAGVPGPVKVSARRPHLRG